MQIILTPIKFGVNIAHDLQETFKFSIYSRLVSKEHSLHACSSVTKFLIMEKETDKKDIAISDRLNPSNIILWYVFYD